MSNLITDRNYETQGAISFTNQSRFEITFNRRYTFLLDDFDPIGGENVVPLPANKGFFTMISRCNSILIIQKIITLILRQL